MSSVDGHQENTWKAQGAGKGESNAAQEGSIKCDVVSLGITVVSAELPCTTTADLLDQAPPICAAPSLPKPEPMLVAFRLSAVAVRS